jgi:AraC family transcriptional regulator
MLDVIIQYLNDGFAGKSKGVTMNKTVIILLALLLLSGLCLAQATEEAQALRYEERGPFLVMGLEAKNAMEGNAMTRAWQDFFLIREKIPEPVGMDAYGIYYPGEEYDPDTMQGMNYFVGIEVKETVEMPKGLMLHKVPGGYYAVFDYVGKIEGIGDAYGYIYGKWMAESGMKIASEEMFEVYDERFQEDSDKSVTEIWIPVVKPVSIESGSE